MTAISIHLRYATILKQLSPKQVPLPRLESSGAQHGFLDHSRLAIQIFGSQASISM